MWLVMPKANPITAAKKRPRRRVPRRIWPWISAAVLLVAVVTGQSQSTTPNFARTSWHVQEGLPENTVQAIQQTASGYLWVGTTGGAVRFDGAHFTPVPGATEGSIFSMLAARDGSLWLGTEGAGLLHVRDGQTSTLSVAQGITDGFVRAILGDRAGRIWVGTDNGLFWIGGEHACQVSASTFPTQFSVHALMQDATGRIWVGGSKLLAFPPPSDPCHAVSGIVSYPLPGAFSENRIKSILETTDHTLWIGTVGGLDHLVGNHVERISSVQGTVRTLRQTSDGSLWVGTIGHGLYVRRPRETFTHVSFGGSPGGNINTVLALFEDDSHQLWVGGQDGLFRLQPTPVRIVPLPGDAPPDFATISIDRGNALWVVSSRVYHLQDGRATPVRFPGLGSVRIRNLTRDRSGALWIGTDGGGVYRQTGAGWAHLLAPEKLVNNFVRAFLETGDGAMWIATDEGVSRIHGDRIENLRMANGLAYFSTRCLLDDRNGDVWIGTERGLSHWYLGRFVQDPLTRALAHEKIWSILQASDATLWFGTRDHGLYHSTNAGLVHLTVADGLASDTIYSLLEDRSHRLWISSPNEISSFLIRSAAAGKDSGSLATTVYELPDGASGTQMYGGRQPAGLIDAKGNLWYPSTRGAVEVSSPVPVDRPSPRVEITGISANDRSFPADTPRIVLPQTTTRLQIAFTPILIRSQAGLRFRYRMEGFDKDWINAGSSRVAAYTSLPAGSYRFVVQVFDAERPDQIADASFALRVPPRFYVTPWFLSLCAAVFGLLIWAVYGLRLRQVRLRFAAVIEERGRLAREMHDTVIQGCTGISALLEAMAILNTANQPLREDLLDHARTQVRSTIDEARQAVWNLRDPSLVCHDLPERLDRLAAQLRRDFASSIACVAHGPTLPIADGIARELLMVVREAAYNAALHGQARHITVRLHTTANMLELEVLDDGVGFDPGRMRRDAALHYGISGMRERIERIGGEFLLSSSAGHGATVRALVAVEHLLPARSRNVSVL